ncbi:hypothetical protein U1Q18_024875 [Sarracenia purpurea var. burkii]
MTSCLVCVASSPKFVSRSCAAGAKCRDGSAGFEWGPLCWKHCVGWVMGQGISGNGLVCGRVFTGAVTGGECGQSEGAAAAFFLSGFKVGLRENSQTATTISEWISATISGWRRPSVAALVLIGNRKEAPARFGGTNGGLAKELPLSEVAGACEEDGTWKKGIDSFRREIRICFSGNHREEGIFGGNDR